MTTPEDDTRDARAYLEARGYVVIHKLASHVLTQCFSCGTQTEITTGPKALIERNDQLVDERDAAVEAIRKAAELFDTVCDDDYGISAWLALPVVQAARKLKPTE
jgi:hypothetical protein